MSTNPNPTMKKLKMKYGLFRLTQEHHEKYLKKTFIKYYEPKGKGFKPNKHWTAGLPVEIMRDLRLHSSWTRGGDMTH